MKHEGPVNKANMRLWVAALRSGIFPQGSKALKSKQDGTFRYCCMGVVCEVAKIRGMELEEVPLEWNGAVYRIDGSPGFLRHKVMKWLGIDHLGGDGNPIVGQKYRALVRACEANDELEWDFHKIADEIERYYGLNDPDESEQEEAGDAAEAGAQTGAVDPEGD